MIMKYYYWIALAVLVFLISYALANKDTIVMEHLTSATTGPMNTGMGPAPANSSSSTKKCYGEPIDFTSGKFLSMTNMNTFIDLTFKTLPKGSNISDTAAKLGTTQSLTEAQKSCSKNSQCKGIVYWDGSMYSRIGPGTDPQLAPFKGYTHYTGDATISEFTQNAPGTFHLGDEKELSQGSFTFTPVIKCPASSSEESGDGGGEGDGDVAALTSKLTALQQEVEDMKKQSKDQMAQASAAQASLQSIT